MLNTFAPIVSTTTVMTTCTSARAETGPTSPWMNWDSIVAPMTSVPGFTRNTPGS